MIIGTTISKNKVKVRLSEERWLHITYSHREIDSADSTEVFNLVENPDFILKGDEEELLAVKKRTRRKIWFVVVYKEIDASDGFIITAYLTTDMKWLLKREIIWNKES